MPNVIPDSLGKSMEEGPAAKRFRLEITTDGCEDFAYDVAYDDCRRHITSVVVPDGIEKLGDHVYMHCYHLTSLTLPNSVKIVGASAFRYCGALTSLTLPNSVKTVGEYAFSNCTGLTSLTLPNSLETIGKHAFLHCEGLTSLIIPNSLKSLGESAFSNCRKLTCVTFPHSVDWGDVGEFAFSGCNDLTSVDFCSMSRPALITWAVGNSRNRANWALTSVMRLRNVLTLITVFALDTRDVDSVDPFGIKGVFMGCPCRVNHGIIPGDEDDYVAEVYDPKDI